MTDRYAHSIFCDDVRREDNGKHLHIGVYASQMLVREFPITLPGLAVVVTSATPIEKPFETLKIRILRDSEEISDGEVPSEVLATAFERVADTDPPELQYLYIQALIRLPMLKLEGPCFLKVRVDTEAEELLGGSLQVLQLTATHTEASN